MPRYTAPTADMRFLLNDVLTIDQYADLPGFEELTPDLVAAILEESAKVAETVLQPINQSGNAQGCRLEDGAVKTPDGFPDAYRTYAEGGWTGLTADPEYGGQGLPGVLGVAVTEMVTGANLAFAMYPALAGGAMHALETFGTDWQKATFLPPLVEGRWAATMNLTEPQAGSDLGLIRTKAEPQDDGTYRITGTKIFISGGDQDLTENIVHLLLARLPDAPEGSKGLSLFIVPKIQVNDDGALGRRNAVTCGALEEKMGIHGNATCVMNYDGATAYLLGEAHGGLKAMFTMMNEARIAVGLQGVGLGEAACQNAADYARERKQGRTDPAKPRSEAEPIINHPDIRRMLLTAHALTEGNRALAYWAALQADLARRGPDGETRRDAELLAGFLTPVVKAFASDKGVEAVNLALQCFGGHGYVREWGMEQFARDARIAPIYEGTNGIQALDLVMRKAPADNGRAVILFTQAIERIIADVDGDEVLSPLARKLRDALDHHRSATDWLMKRMPQSSETGGAGAMDYLHLTGLVGAGAMSLKMATVAQRKLAEAPEDVFYRNKIAAARCFMERILPETAARRAAVEAGAENIMAVPADAF